MAMDKQAIIKASMELAQILDETLMPKLQAWHMANPEVPPDVITGVLAGAAGQLCGIAGGNVEEAKKAIEIAYQQGVKMRETAEQQAKAKAAQAAPP